VKVKKIGQIDPRLITRAQLEASSQCEATFETSPEVKACKVGSALTAVTLRREAAAVLSAKLGVFQECAFPCPEGLEKVVLKKPDPATGKRGVCICRLGPFSRKKHRGLVQREGARKPFGSEARPVHLRRCVEVDERGRCVREGPPFITYRRTE